MTGIFLKTATWVGVCIASGFAVADLLSLVTVPHVSEQVGKLTGLVMFVAGYAYEGGL